MTSKQSGTSVVRTRSWTLTNLNQLATGRHGLNKWLTADPQTDPQRGAVKNSTCCPQAVRVTRPLRRCYSIQLSEGPERH